MTQEEKDILIADLCGRLPYKVKCSTPYGIGVLDSIDMEHMDLTFEGPDDNYYTLDRNIKPYLRPMSSMTEEEREEFRLLGGIISYNPNHNTYSMSAFSPEAYDWLNKNMFDYRGLIPKGLALEAKEGLYNN